MSTRSLLYHGFGLGVVEPLKTEFSGGDVKIHARTPVDRLRCAKCHSSDIVRRGGVWRSFRALPIGRKAVWIIYWVSRLECRDCATLAQEKLGFADARQRHTRSFARYVLELSKLGTISAVAKHLGVSWNWVRDVQEVDMQKEAMKLQLHDLRELAIDELAVGKGHRYVTVVLNLANGQVVHVGDGKGADAVTGFFAKLKHSGADLKAVAMDMSGAYQLAVRTHFPDASIVFDHFHVVKLMNEKLSQLRRQLQNDADALGKKTIKGTRWLLLKDPGKLDDDKNEKARLDEALKLNQPLAQAYYLKEELRLFWNCRGEALAKILLGRWIARAKASGVLVLEQMANTLIRHRQGLLNYFRHRISTGPLEGFNNKAQTMKRQAYGYRNLEFYKLKLMTLHRKRFALVG